MSRDTLILLGAGGHARACIDVIEQEGRYSIGGLIGTAVEVGTTVLGYPVLGSDSDIPDLLPSHDYALVAVGQIVSPEIRIRLFGHVTQGDRCPPAIISPHAYVSPHASVGAGSIVLHGSVINAGAIIGRNCIINSLALVEHDAVVADHCHVATGVRLNSGVRVGNGTFVGSGAVVRQGIIIGENCLIGMGISVLADCASGARLPPERKPA